MPSERVKKILQKKRVIALSFFIAFALLLILFRNSFLGFALELFINSKFETRRGIKCSFEKLAFRQKSLIFSNFEMHGDELPFHLAIKKVALGLEFNLLEFEVEPTIDLDSPKITLLKKAGGQAAPSRLLKALNHHLILNIRAGELLFEDQEIPLHFSFDTQKEEDHLKLFNTKDQEVVHVKLKSNVIEAIFHSFDLNVLSHFPAFNFKQWHLEGGELSGFLSAEILPKGKVGRIEFTSDIAKLKMHDSKTGIQLCLDKGEFIFQEEMKAVFSGLYVKLDHHTDLTLRGGLEEGTIHLNGGLKIDNETSDIALKGKIDDAFQFGFLLGISKNDCEISSIDCKFENTKMGHSLFRGKLQKVDVSHLNLLHKLLCPYVPELAKIDLKEGSFECEFIAEILDHKISKIHVEKIKADHLHLYFDQQLFKLFCSQLEGALDINLGTRKVDRWSLCIEEGDISYRQWQIHDLQARVFSDLDAFSYSTVKGRLFDHLFEIALCGQRNAPDLDIKIKTNTEAILSHFRKEGKAKAPQRENYELHLALERELDSWRVKGVLEGALNFGCKLTDFSRKETVLDQIKEIKNHIFSGWFKGRGLKEGYYQWITYLLDFDWDLKGIVDVIGRFDGAKVKCDITSKDFSFLSKVVDVNVKEKEHKQMTASLIYYFEEEKLDLSVPISGASCKIKEFNLDFSGVSGDLYIRDDKLFIHHLEGNSHNLIVKGQLDLAFEQKEPSYLEIRMQDIKGNAKDLMAFAAHFPDFANVNFDVDGDILSRGQGFVFKSTLLGDDIEPVWKLSIHLSNATCDLEELRLNNFESDIDFFSYDDACQLSNYRGKLIFNEVETPYFVAGKYLIFGMNKKGLVEVDLRVEDELLTLLQVQATAEKQGNGYIWSIDPKQTHFLNSSLECHGFESNDHFKQWKGNLQFDLDGKELKSFLSLYPKIDLECHDFLQVDLAFNQSEKAISLDLQCREMSLLPIRSRPFHLLLEKKGRDIELVDFLFGDCGLSLKGHKDGNQIALERGSIKYGNSNLILAEGSFNLSSLTLSIAIEEGKIFGNDFKEYPLFENVGADIRGDLEIEENRVWARFFLEAQNDKYQLVSKNPLNFEYSKDLGLALLNINASLIDKEKGRPCVELLADSIQTNFKATKGQNIEVGFDPEIIPLFSSEINGNSWIEAQGNFEKEGPHLFITGLLKEGKYVFRGREFQLSSSKFSYLDGKIEASCATILSGQSVLASGKLDLNRVQIDIKPNLPFVEESDGFSILGSLSEAHEFKLESVHGKMCGSNFHFEAVSNEMILAGGASIDLEKWIPHFKPELKDHFLSLGLNQPIIVHGDIVLMGEDYEDSYFKGFIKGRDLKIAGYELRNLIGDLFINNKRATIQNLRLSDQAGLFVVEEASFIKKEENVEFEVKGIEVHEFRPSLMRTLKDPKPKARPFVVRSLTIGQLKGNFSDLSSIQGKGQLYFLNTFKSDHHLRLIPLEIITRLGLDLGLMVPVRGEIDFQIENQKIKLVQLKNSFSEGKRSHFYFPTMKGCYIGFNGEICIDVKMKQYVLFKITQPFTLSIRGSLMKPKVSLK